MKQELLLSLRKVLMELLASKKAMAFITSIITIISSRIFGQEFTNSVVLPIAGVVMTYLFAQGLADFGKEGKKIDNKGIENGAK